MVCFVQGKSLAPIPEDEAELEEDKELELVENEEEERSGKELENGESQEKYVMDAAVTASKRRTECKVPFQQRKMLRPKFREGKCHPINNQVGRRYQNRKDTLFLITHVGKELKMTLLTKMMTLKKRTLSLNSIFVFKLLV